MYSITMDPLAPIDEVHFRRLLVAIDGSPSSELALAAAVTVARRDNAALTLICVVADVVADSARWAWPGAPPPDQEAIDRHAEDVLREAVERIPDDIPVCRIMKRGRAGPA